MSEYFPELKSLGKVKVELDLCNYPTKIDLKGATRVNASFFGKKTDLANLKPDVDKLDADKLKNVTNNFSSLERKVDQLDVKLVSFPVDLSKLRDVVKTDVVKKDLYNAKIKMLKIKYLILLT